MTRTFILTGFFGLNLLDEVSLANNHAVLVQFVSSVMFTLIYLALILGFPDGSVSIGTEPPGKKARETYFIATLVVLAPNEAAFSSATRVKSDLTLAEGKPCGRIQAVVLSTYSTAMFLPPLWMFLISWLDTYFADIVARTVK